MNISSLTEIQVLTTLRTITIRENSQLLSPFLQEKEQLEGVLFIQYRPVPEILACLALVQEWRIV